LEEKMEKRLRGSRSGFELKLTENSAVLSETIWVAERQHLQAMELK
jgi:hypothetical protein